MFKKEAKYWNAYKPKYNLNGNIYPKYIITFEEITTLNKLFNLLWEQ